jgi:hypothetical protein
MADRRVSGYKPAVKIAKEIAIQCAHAVTYGPFISDTEFQTRIGLYRSEAKEIVGSLSGRDFSNLADDDKLLINNCFNEIAHGIQLSRVDREKWVNYSSQEIKQAYADLGPILR